MTHDSLDALVTDERDALSPGPVALVFAEDTAAVEATLVHHMESGFAAVVLLAPRWVLDRCAVPPGVVAVVHDVRTARGGIAAAVSRVWAAVAPGTWVYAGYNAEFLFHPFRETRSLPEMLAFHEGERRAAVPCMTVDLYPDDLGAVPDGVAAGSVARERAHLDAGGYYGLPVRDPERGWAALDRQVELHGGLRWRFEAQIPWERRRLDRIALVQVARGLALTGDWRVAGDAERNTVNCPWHRNVTAAVASFRVAKALASNPASRERIDSLMGPTSVPFDWTARQLMDLGFMEPGQWF